MSNVFTIPADQPFTDRLAEGVLARYGDDPVALGGVTILLPTRRACRALREAFLRVSGGAGTLLPSMRPLGDVDEEGLQVESGFDERLASAMADIPPAIGDLRRQMMLTRTILAQRDLQTAPVTPEQAALLAAALAALIDQVHTEGLDFAGLPGLVEGELAEYWQRTVAFMTIVTEAWPAVLAEEGRIDPADRRNRLLRALADLWRRDPPVDPVIAAGSTGSIPASAELMSVVAGLANGAVVLPGLDETLEDEAWHRAALEESHPQFGLARLLARLKTDRSSIGDWVDAGPGDTARRRLLSDAMRPAASTDAWRRRQGSDYGGAATALAGFRRLDCPGVEAEAGAIALMLRRSLETPRRTAALITPDRDLARRVAASLRRWGIDVDDSAGTPLTATPAGVFFRALSGAVESGFAPVALLCLLKHPLCRAGLPAGEIRAAIRLLERRLLRGPKPAPGLAGLYSALGVAKMEDRERTVIGDILDRLDDCLRPYTDRVEAGPSPIADLLTAQAAAAEALAATDTETGATRLWRGGDGEALADFIAELLDAARGVEPVSPDACAGLIPALMRARVVRPVHGAHPRLSIWGPLEARLQHADLVVLGGLNEGVWPPDAPTDPWMSRPMRRRFGLPAPERRIGLAAHDFAQAAAAPEVVLTRSLKSDGQPTVPSRWLTRLDALLTHLGWADDLRAGDPWPGWRAALIASGLPARPAPRPAPRPPVAARPNGLSVTRVEAWMRDPYVIYAQYILELKPLDPLEADPGAAERGSFIHTALDTFVAAHPDGLPPDAFERLLDHGRAAFGDALTRPGVLGFWWPRFERIARWFVAEETARRREIEKSFTEITGKITLDTGSGGFEIRAKADRIDLLAGGGYAIVDYKTGQPPTDKAVADGKFPQLPLEAAILNGGGFPGIENATTGRLEYWRLSGGDPAGETRILTKAEPEPAAARAVDGVVRLARSFADPATPYLAMPRPSFALPYNDYAHLARIAEWGLPGGETE